MFVSDFDYDVPPDLIATKAIQPRSAAKMLVIRRKSSHSPFQDSTFLHLPQYLKRGDLLVTNDTHVIPALFFAKRTTGAQLEGLYLGPTESECIQVWLKGKVVSGERIQLEDGRYVEVVARHEKEAILNVSESAFRSYLDVHGRVPLPPYIRREREKRAEDEGSCDEEDYQTMFSQRNSLISVAAPTASLHFDAELLQSLELAGVERLSVSLGVGAGTFAPLENEALEKNQLHREPVRIPPSAWTRVTEQRARGGRVIAVGTTVTRALESAALRTERGESPEDFYTDLFIYPPYSFRVVDGLITNFHWPKSSLLAMVSAFLSGGSGSEKNSLAPSWRDVYDYAIRNQYRLFSYGDGMFIE